jgi:hypothetical protein
MGAYSNPDQNAGVDALRQEGQAYQNMFDTITKTVTSVSEKIAERHRTNEKKNKAILDQTEEDGSKLQVLLEKGIGKEKTGLNYDCYQEAIGEYKTINNKIGAGIATPDEKRRAAQIVASIDNFSGTAADTHGLIENWDKSMKMIGEGSPDLAGCDHDMVRALNALKNRDGNQIQPGFYKDENGTYDYTNHGYILSGYKDADGVEYPEKFISGKELKSALDTGGASGMVYKKSYSGDNKKISDAFKIGDDGMGIFEYNKNEPTGKVAEDYLTDEPGQEITVKKVQGGVWKQKTLKIDKNKILNSVGTQLDAVADASATVTNEVATKYNNYVLPIVDKDRNPNFDKYNQLEEFAKFVPIPGYDKAFPYNKAILTSDEETLNAIRHNNRAAFAQTLKNEQPVGEMYFVPEPKPEKPTKGAGGKTTKVPAAVAKQKDFDERIKSVIASGKGGTPIKNGYTLTKDENGNWALLDKDGLPKPGTEREHDPYVLQSYIGGTAKRGLK